MNQNSSVTVCGCDTGLGSYKTELKPGMETIGLISEGKRSFEVKRKTRGGNRTGRKRGCSD